MIRFLYSLAGTLITPFVHLLLRRRAHRGKEENLRMRERFGHAATPRPTGTLIWLHAASVGETQSVLTLVHALLAQHPHMHLLVTTGTVTSAALVAQQQIDRVIHHYIPVDTYFSVARFLRHWQPNLALWVESELWPQLLWQTHDKKIPMLLINARMSAYSLAGWKKWPRTIRSLLACFTTIYAGSQTDAQHFIALGATDVRDVGNLKYDAAALPTDHLLLAEISRMTADRRVWVAASTHANEEQMVAIVHRHAAQQFPGLLCILIPRHATRGDAIAADLRSRGTRVAQRSKNEPITADTELYLADTMGELGSFYRLADIVFLGGSLVATGGHNPLEPARLCASILSGPHVHNFAAIMQHLAANDGIRIVPDKEALATTLTALLHDDTARLGMAERALTIVTAARGASESIVQHAIQLVQERT